MTTTAETADLKVRRALRRLTTAFALFGAATVVVVVMAYLKAEWWGWPQLVYLALLLVGFLILLTPSVAVAVYSPRRGAELSRPLRLTALVTALAQTGLGVFVALLTAGSWGFGIGVMWALFGGYVALSTLRLPAPAPEVTAVPFRGHVAPLVAASVGIMACFVWLALGGADIASAERAHHVRMARADRIGAVKNDLRNLVYAQDSYFTDHLSYAGDPSLLASHGFHSSPSVVTVIERTESGWRAIGTHQSGLRCSVYFGTGVPIGPGSDGEPACNGGRARRGEEPAATQQPTPQATAARKVAELRTLIVAHYSGTRRGHAALQLLDSILARACGLGEVFSTLNCAPPPWMSTRHRPLLDSLRAAVRAHFVPLLASRRVALPDLDGFVRRYRAVEDPQVLMRHASGPPLTWTRRAAVEDLEDIAKTRSLWADSTEIVYLSDVAGLASFYAVWKYETGNAVDDGGTRAARLSREWWNFDTASTSHRRLELNANGRVRDGGGRWWLVADTLCLQTVRAGPATCRPYSIERQPRGEGGFWLLRWGEETYESCPGVAGLGGGITCRREAG